MARVRVERRAVVAIYHRTENAHSKLEPRLYEETSKFASNSAVTCKCRKGQCYVRANGRSVGVLMRSQQRQFQLTFLTERRHWPLGVIHPILLRLLFAYANNEICTLSTSLHRLSFVWSRGSLEVSLPRAHVSVSVSTPK